MIKFLHQLFNPHCQHCAAERREQRAIAKEELLSKIEAEAARIETEKHCISCDVLARENDRLVRDNERLIEALLAKPVVPTEKQIDVRDLKPIQTSRTPFIPSAVRRQMLEKESRHTAQLAKDAPKPDVVIDKDVELKELEEELDNVRAEREAKVS